MIFGKNDFSEMLMYNKPVHDGFFLTSPCIAKYHELEGHRRIRPYKKTILVKLRFPIFRFQDHLKSSA